MAPTTRRLLSIAPLAGVVAALALPAGAGAAPTMRFCGDLESGGVLIGDVTTKGVTCETARTLSRAVPAACGTGASGSCQVRGFTCLVARAAPELRLARCSQAGAGSELHRVVRFDYGS